MSGSLAVPFTVAAIVLPSAHGQILFGGQAVLAFLITDIGYGRMSDDWSLV